MYLDSWGLLLDWESLGLINASSLWCLIGETANNPKAAGYTDSCCDMIVAI